MRTAHLIFAALTLAAGVTSLHAEEYRLPEKNPGIGSLLRYDAARLSFPPEKVYADLPDADKARMRAMYEQMGPDDEPPYPARGYAPLLRVMSALQGKYRVDALIDIGVIVGPDGKASDIKIYGSPDPQLAHSVANALVLESYKPALCGGTPCAQEFPFRVQFTLKR